MMRIHPAGFRPLFISFVTLGFTNLLLFLALSNLIVWLLLFLVPSLVLFILMLRFFRYPNRKPADLSNNTVLAAADGVIVAIEEIHDEQFMKGPAIQISTFMSPYNVHLNWVPVDGKAEVVAYFPGKYLLARHPKSSMLNEMSCVMFVTEHGHHIVVKQIAGFVARRILPFLKEGKAYMKGDELGFIRFGSRVDMLLPVSSKIQVHIGQKIRGLETVIALL
jgi:phosphatidylserine decarboxylase